MGLAPPPQYQDLALVLHIDALLTKQPTNGAPARARVTVVRSLKGACEERSLLSLWPPSGESAFYAARGGSADEWSRAPAFAPREGGTYIVHARHQAAAAPPKPGEPTFLPMLGEPIGEPHLVVDLRLVHEWSEAEEQRARAMIEQLGGPPR